MRRSIKALIDATRSRARRGYGIYTSIKVLPRREERMKAIIDREQTGERRIAGVTMVLVGKIKGKDRASKRVIKVGRQRQQNRRSRITADCSAIQTKHGTLGLRVQCGVETFRAQTEQSREALR